VSSAGAAAPGSDEGSAPEDFTTSRSALPGDSNLIIARLIWKVYRDVKVRHLCTEEVRVMGIWRLLYMTRR
jgi:hypothetical protein